MIIACAESSLSNPTSSKCLLEDYCKILLRTGHLIEWTLLFWKSALCKRWRHSIVKVCVWTHSCTVSYVHVYVKAKKEGNIRSDWASRATLSCGMGSSKRGGVGGWLGCLPRPQGLSKAAHTWSDMQQIVTALPPTTLDWWAVTAQGLATTRGFQTKTLLDSVWKCHTASVFNSFTCVGECVFVRAGGRWMCVINFQSTHSSAWRIVGVCFW